MNMGPHKFSLNLPSRCKDTATDVINAFDPTPMSARLNSILRLREPGTNSGQLKDEKLTSWIKGSTDQHWEVPEQEQPVSQIKKLFLYGFSGCGRTTLTASVIEHLISTECTEKQGVCYYFCSRFHQGTEYPHNVLRTLISQLAQQNESAFDVLNGYLKTRKVLPESIDHNSCSLEDLGTLLESVIRRFERVFIIINSVEFLLPDNAARLLSLLSGLSENPKTNVSLLSTGAEQPGQRELSQKLNFCPLYVQGRPDDIRVYVRAELNRRVERGDNKLDQSHFKTTIENYIVERSNGAWLWAICELDNQCHKALQGRWEQTPTLVPLDSSAHPYHTYGPNQNDLSSAIFPYRHYFHEMWKNGGPRANFLLVRLLRWTHVGAAIPGLRFSISDMCDLLSILLLYHKIEDNIPHATVNEEELTRIGGQLIRKAPDSSTLEFSHVTVEGYLMCHLDDNMKEFSLDGQIDSEMIDELDIVSSQMERTGRLKNAEAMMLRLIPCREQLWGPTGNPILAAFNNLGRFYEEHDRIEEAQGLYTRALNGYEAAKNPNKESMFNTVNNLGILYKRRGMFPEAEALYKRALAGREELFGPLHNDTLSSMHCLGLLYATQGRLDEAAPLWEKYLHALQEKKGFEDPQTIIATYDLGTLYKNDDRIDEAIPLLERAFTSYGRTKGQDDPATLDSLDALATAHAMKGQYEEAETLWKRLLEARQRSPGFDFDLIQTKENLGQLYSRQDRLQEALEIYRSVLQSYKLHYGSAHVAVGEMCGTLADLYEDMDLLDLAEDMQLQAFHIFENCLGSEDIATATMAEKVGFTCAKQGRIDEAAPFWETALRGFEKVHGEDHRSVLGQMGNLGRVYKMQFRLDEAETILKLGFERSMRALGPQDSLTQRIGQDLILLHENQEQPEEADKISDLLNS